MHARRHGKFMRKQAIVDLARKLTLAAWRCIMDGPVPAGAVFEKGCEVVMIARDAR